MDKTLILKVFFVPLNENSPFVKNDSQGLRNIHTTINSCKVTFYEQYNSKIILVASPNDGEASWSLLLRFWLLIIRRYSATKKRLFPYPQGDSSGLREPKRISINLNYSCHSQLSQSMPLMSFWCLYC